MIGETVGWCQRNHPSFKEEREAVWFGIAFGLVGTEPQSRTPAISIFEAAASFTTKEPNRNEHFAQDATPVGEWDSDG